MELFTEGAAIMVEFLLRVWALLISLHAVKVWTLFEKTIFGAWSLSCAFSSPFLPYSILIFSRSSFREESVEWIIPWQQIGKPNVSSKTERAEESWAAGATLSVCPLFCSATSHFLRSRQKTNVEKNSNVIISWKSNEKSQYIFVAWEGSLFLTLKRLKDDFLSGAPWFGNLSKELEKFFFWGFFATVFSSSFLERPWKSG